MNHLSREKKNDEIKKGTETRLPLTVATYST